MNVPDPETCRYSSLMKCGMMAEGCGREFIAICMRKTWKRNRKRELSTELEQILFIPGCCYCLCTRDNEGEVRTVT